MPDFIFNIGYDISHIISVISTEGLEDGSSVVLIVPEDINDRQRNAIDEVGSYLSSLDMDVSLETFTSGSSFQEDIVNFSNLLSETDDTVLSLSGGPRDFVVPLAISSAIKGESVEKTYFRSDIDSSLEEINVPDMELDFKDSDIEVLRSLDESLEAKEIVSLTDLSDSSVYRSLSDLREKNAVESNGKSFSRTSVGDLWLNLFSPE